MSVLEGTWGEEEEYSGNLREQRLKGRVFSQYRIKKREERKSTKSWLQNMFIRKDKQFQGHKSLVIEPSCLGTPIQFLLS